MTVERMIELLEIEKECVLRNASGECNRNCAGCDLLQDDTELHEMYTEAIAMLKAQEPRVIIDEELMDRIRKAPIVQIQAADAVPVEHAVWKERHHAYSDEEAPIEEWQSAKCSKCGKYHTTPYLYYFTDYAYCPNCGVR